jgi:hypothetical protein
MMNETLILYFSPNSPNAVDWLSAQTVPQQDEFVWNVSNAKIEIRNKFVTK